MKLDGQCVGRWPTQITKPGARESILGKTRRHADYGQQGAFGQKRLREFKAAGPQRFENCEIVPAPERLGHQKPGEIATGDEGQRRRQAEQGNEKQEERSFRAHFRVIRGQAGHGDHAGYGFRQLPAPDPLRCSG
jgi:hypothetical protein